MTDETTPDAVEMLQRMHACVVLSENHGDVPRVSSDEVLAVLRATQDERARHAEEVAALRDQLRKVTAELDGERERATKMEAELADRRAHDEDVRTCLEYCDEDDPTPGGVGGLARELLEWFSGRTA